MHENILATAERLTDDELLARVKSLALRERDATVELVAHLAVLDARRIHLGEGPGSLYKYCHEALGYSEDAAWNRAATAGVVRRYPFVLDWLADGSLNVTTVRMLKSVLTAENHLAVLTEARHRTKKEVEVIVRRLDPKPDGPTTIRMIAAPRPQLPSLPLEGDCPISGDRVVTESTAPAVDRGARAAVVQAVVVPPRPVVAPLTAERYRVQFTVSKGTYDKLQRARNLLCREVPSGDPAVIFERALDLLLNAVEAKKLATTDKPRAPRNARAGSRKVPAHVKRAVSSDLVFGPWVARETPAIYAVSREIASFRNDGPAVTSHGGTETRRTESSV